MSGTEIAYDYLVYAVGAENQTFGIKGVKEHACFLKEVWDAEKIRSRIMDSIESANFAGQTQEEIDRLLSFVRPLAFLRVWHTWLTWREFLAQVVVGGGPTGVEYAGELHDFLMEDLNNVRCTSLAPLPSLSAKS